MIPFVTPFKNIKFLCHALTSDSQNKDQHFYTQNGLLNMLDRNRRIKEKPERFQDCKAEFDIIVTCQERVFDQVLECKSDSSFKTRWFTQHPAGIMYYV